MWAKEHPTRVTFAGLGADDTRSDDPTFVHHMTQLTSATSSDAPMATTAGSVGCHCAS